MRMTKALKSWIIANLGVAADASDDVLKKAAGDALVSGKLTADKLAELSTPEETPAANAFEKQMGALTDAVTSLVKLHTAGATPTAATGAAGTAATGADKGATADADKAGGTSDKAGSPIDKAMAAAAAGEKAAAGMTTEGGVRVKRAHEEYSRTKTALTYGSHTKQGRPHALAGMPVKDFSHEGEGARTIDSPSDYDKAAAGVYAKLLCATRLKGGSRTLGYMSLNDHDKDLLNYILDEEKWGGYIGDDPEGEGRKANIVNRKLSPVERKALIDDAISGGVEAAPIVFDDQVISAPLLNGELFPLVNVVPLDRGRRVEGVSTGTVTGSWGGVDDTEVALFNTASYVSAFDTTIFRWEGAIRIGLDFLGDSPIDFGAHVTSQYGERLLEDLDDVVATGNGSTQPEGVINKSGATSVNFGAATTLGNYESLMFGIGKNERRPGVAASTVFCGTDTSYQRARAIPVGASDARRLGGMGGFGGVNSGGGYLSYTWMDHPYKINNSLTNAQIFYAILARYRMYRRRGLTMRTSTEGDTLIRRNEMLMVCMARYGGQMERAACVVVTTTAPT